MNEPASAEPRSRRGGIAPGWVLGALLLSFVAAFGAAVLIYQRYVAFERRAARHLVGDAQFVVRADLEKIVLYAPFRDEVLPLLQGVPGTDAASRLKPRLVRLSQHTGVELGVDVREIVYSRGRRADSWVLAVGGMFPKTGVVQGIHETLLEEGHRTRFDADTGRLQLSTGVVMAQAADAVVLLASDPQALASALAPSERYEELGLGLGKPALSLAVAAGVGLGASGAALGGASTRLNVALDADQPETLRLILHEPAADTSGRVAALVAEVTGLSRDSIQFKVDGPSHWVATVPVTGEHVKRAAARWAGLLRKAAFPTF